MAEIIDRKYKILAVNPCNGHIHTETDGFYVTAKDITAISGIWAMLKAAKEVGCDSAHIESLELLGKRVGEFQAKYGTKIPDTETPCEIDRCIGGKV